MTTLQESRKIVKEYFSSEEGLQKLKQLGVVVEDEFYKTLTFEQIIKNLANTHVSIKESQEVFGEEFYNDIRAAIGEYLTEFADLDGFTVRIQDAEGKDIYLGRMSSKFLFGTYEAKVAAASHIAKCAMDVLMYSLPTHSELTNLLNKNHELYNADIGSFIKNNFDWFAKEKVAGGDKPRNDIILDFIEKERPKLRALIKEETGY